MAGAVLIIGVVGNGCAVPSVSLVDAGSMGGGDNGSVSTSASVYLLDVNQGITQG